MSETQTSLEIGISNSISYKTHPSVIVNILDVFYRNTEKPFILGILLGHIYPDYVNITNAVFVPSGMTASGEIAIDNELLNRLLEYNGKIFNESRVGWFITKNTIDSEVAIIHKHLLPNLKSQTNNWAGPLILQVEPSLTNDKINLHGFVSQPNKMFRESFALFQPVKINVELFNESLATGQLLYGNLETKRTYNEAVENSYDTFQKTLKNSLGNMKDLLKNLEEMDEESLNKYPELIKDIKSLLCSRFSAVNYNNKEEIDRFVEDNQHLRYLTDIGHIQLIISEKLSNKVELTD